MESWVVVVVSLSVVRLGHTGISRNAATNRKRSGPYHTATRGVPVRSASGIKERVWWLFPVAMHAAAGRPGGCEHFPCFGHSCMTSDLSQARLLIIVAQHLPLTAGFLGCHIKVVFIRTSVQGGRHTPTPVATADYQTGKKRSVKKVR